MFRTKLSVKKAKKKKKKKNIIKKNRAPFSEILDPPLKSGAFPLKKIGELIVTTPIYLKKAHYRYVYYLKICTGSNVTRFEFQSLKLLLTKCRPE